MKNFKSLTQDGPSGANVVYSVCLRWPCKWAAILVLRKLRRGWIPHSAWWRLPRGEQILQTGGPQRPSAAQQTLIAVPRTLRKGEPSHNWQSRPSILPSLSLGGVGGVLFWLCTILGHADGHGVCVYDGGEEGDAVPIEGHCLSVLNVPMWSESHTAE